MATIKASCLDVIYKAEAVREEATPQGLAQHEDTLAPHSISASLGEPQQVPTATANPTKAAPMNDKPLENQYKNVGRNDLCPCGSGKKFKKCHGA
jgi:preprotein translocase subunit SecA